STPPNWASPSRIRRSSRPPWPPSPRRPRRSCLSTTMSLTCWRHGAAVCTPSSTFPETACATCWRPMILRYDLVAPARGDMVTASRRATVAWLVVAVVGQAFGVEAVRRVFVGTVRGQQLDTVALTGGEVGQDRVAGLVAAVLDTVSVLSVAFATVAIGIIAVLRRRFLLAAVATGMVVAANVTTQVLKALAHRPEFGVDLARAAVGNSLPSGHTTVTASVAAGWHRPSDAVAALLVVGAWAAVAGLVLVAAGGDPPATPAGPGPEPSGSGLRVSSGSGWQEPPAATPNRMALLALVAVTLAAS